MVEAATEFRKNSFNDEDSAQLAQVATMYQNVADESISAADSASFIIAQMKAFNIEAEDATHIIDAVNAVSNNFAVSSADLANTLGNASAALAVGNNSFEETLALKLIGQVKVL
jgi:TP901 family phage tail tape measure protein